MAESLNEHNSEIEECLATFKNAIFGEEVRDALIRAIELCYTDIVNSIVQHGLKGDQGIPGKSAYQLAIDSGAFSGTFSEWLDSLKGEQGPPGSIEGEEITIDGDLDPNSSNPVQNRVITSALNNKLQKQPFNPADYNMAVVVKSDGSIARKPIKFGTDIFIAPGNQNATAATEMGVVNYVHEHYYDIEESDNRYLQASDITGKANSEDVYTKNESDQKYVQSAQIDDQLDITSENPVQNKVVAAAINAIPEHQITVDDALSQSSENPVQNKVVTEALNLKLGIDSIKNAIDAALSFEDPDDEFDSTPIMGLFVEREEFEDRYGNTCYRYYLSYIDSSAANLSPEAITPNSSCWHRMIDFSALFEQVDYRLPSINEYGDLLSSDDKEAYYPSVKLMEQYVAAALQNYARTSALSEVQNEIGILSNLPTTNKSNLVAAISETFTSVSNGKALVASAITDKGVTTASDATFSQMAQNIGNIPTGTTPTGIKNITTNGTHDVTNYASANVNVATGSMNSKCFSVTLSADVSGGYVTVNPSGDSDIASHRNDTGFVVGCIALDSVSGTSTRAAIVGNNILHSVQATPPYGIYMRSSASGVSGLPMNNPVNASPSQTPGGVTVDSDGIIKLFGSSSYPYKAGDYIVICGW